MDVCQRFETYSLHFIIIVKEHIVIENKGLQSCPIIFVIEASLKIFVFLNTGD